MVIRGTIFHHDRLVFHNGFVGKKYLILLNSPDRNDPYLFVKTTSQRKQKPSTPGCIEYLSLFFLPSGATFFRLDTWVQLYEIYEFRDVDKDPNLKIAGTFNTKLIDKIVNCLFLAREKDIFPTHEKLLRPPLTKSIQKLAEKWKKN